MLFRYSISHVQTNKFNIKTANEKQRERKKNIANEYETYPTNENIMKRTADADEKYPTKYVNFGIFFSIYNWNDHGNKVTLYF